MIRTVSLNPAVDKTVTVARFGLGTVNRVTAVRLDAGGKGLNVARVVHALGEPVVAVAAVAGTAGRFLAQRLSDEGVVCAFVEGEGETRTNLKIVDPVLGTHTDVNEPGTPLSADGLEAVERLAFDALGPGDWLVLTGSLPPGAPVDLYGRWTTEAHRRGARVVVDADGEAFAQGVAAGPDLVKPNRAEAERWAGRPLGDDEALEGVVADLRGAGAQAVALTLGAEGAWFVSPAGLWKARGPRVDVKSTVGAGDALVAALTVALSQGREPAEALGWAVAVATASVVKPGTGAGDPADAARFLAQVTVEASSGSTGRAPSSRR